MERSGFQCNFTFNGWRDLPGFSADTQSGAVNYHTLFKLGGKATGLVLPYEQSNVLLRVSRLFVDNGLAEWAAKVQAGQNGFAKQLGDLGVEVTGRDFKPPLLSGGQSVDFDKAELENRTKLEQASFAVAGLEAQRELADEVMFGAFQRGSLHVSDAWFYLMNQHAGSLAWTQSSALKGYSTALNMDGAAVDQLKKMQLLPFAGMGSYSALMGVWNYLRHGEVESPLQTFEVAGYEVLPDLQLYFSPQGPQAGLSALIRTEEGQVVKAAARGTLSDLAISVEAPELYTFREKLIFGLGLEAWKQQGGYGGAAKGSVGWNVDEFTVLSFNVAGKTVGYTPGRPYGQDVTFGVKLSSRF